MSYPLTHEYLALERYVSRHRCSRFKAIDRKWYAQELQAVVRLLAHDDRPSEVDYHALQRDYQIQTYFPFVKEAE